MDIIDSTLTWYGAGVVIGIGFVTIVIVAIKLADLYHKIFPKKAQPNYEFLERQLYEMGRDFVLFSYDFKTTSDMLKTKIRELRTELWAKDIVLQRIAFATASFPPGQNCVIKVEGKEIFNGEIDSKLSDEQKAAAIIGHIRNYFVTKKFQGLTDKGETENGK